jgi:molecular chaperone IbpA
MTMIDFTPLYRTAVGFDRFASMLEDSARAEAAGYPPYNIELTGENQYRITMALAGFTENDIEIEVKENMLRVAGKKPEEAPEAKYLHRGIANRAFERRFNLADYIQVEGAQLRDGMLHIELLREVPEAAKPRRISINQGDSQQTIESKVAAA